jgi:hypothetical protein
VQDASYLRSQAGQVLLAQAQQSAGRNATTPSRRECADGCCASAIARGLKRWNSSRSFLAQMLGVRRTSVSLVAGTLQKAKHDPLPARPHQDHRRRGGAKRRVRMLRKGALTMSRC